MGTGKVFVLLSGLVSYFVASRVKALQTLNISLSSPPPSTLPTTDTSAIRRHPHSTTIVSTVSSDGKINVYDLGHLHEFNAGKISIQEIQPVATYDTKGTRLTCVTLGEGEIGNENVTGKRNRERQEVEEDDDEESAEDEEWGGVGADEEAEEEEGEEDEEEESD